MSKLSYFNKKSDAISYWDKHKDEHLFQIDKDVKSGAKKFIVGSLDNLWELLKSGKNHLYESWEDKPIHFALDVDMKKDDLINYEDVVLNIKQIITGILLAVNNSDITEINLNNVVVLENENQSKEDVDKYSFHIIFRGLVMENYLAADKFFDDLEGINLIGCDKSIYRKTCFRTCFSSKITKNQTMVPMILEFGKKKTDNENNYSSLKEFWKSTLICNVKDYKIVYFAEEKEEEIQVNYNNGKPVDVAHLEKVIMQLPNKYFDDYFYWSRIGMILRNSAGDQVQLFELFNKFSMQSTGKYKSKDDIKKHWKSFTDNRKNKISVGTLYLWCKNEKISFSEDKTLEEMISEYPIRTLEVSHEYKEINKRYVPIEEMPELLKHKLIGIQSEKGTGKTTTLFKYLFDEKFLSKDDSVLFISSRRTFGIKLLGDIKKFGFKLYSEMKEYQIDHDKMICQIDSILRLNNDKFKYIIIDECESMMRYMTSSHFTKNNRATLIVSNFETRVAEAEKVIIMDADLCDRSINYFKELLNISEEKDVKLLVNKYQPYSDYEIKYMSYSTWLKVLTDKIENKKKVVVPMASNNYAKDLKLLLENRYPDIKVLLIHRETSDTDKMDQVINVNEKWSSYNVVIYTPSVCMGISFDEDYFDCIFAYGCENSLGSQEFCQMLHRVRSPKETSIYIALDKYVEYEKDRHNIDISKVNEIMCYDYYLTHFNLHNNLIPKKYLPNTKKDNISKLLDGSGGSIVILKEEEVNSNNNVEYIEEKKFIYPYKDEPIFKVFLKNAQELVLDRLNFGNQLFGYFKMKGYKLVKHDWEDGEIIKNEIKEIRELRKEEEESKEIDGIFNAPDLTDDEFKELMNKRREELSQEELFKLQKRNFKKCYVLDNVNKDILSKYKDHTKMKHYHNLSVILPIKDEKIETRLDDIRLERVNNQYIMGAYSDLTIKNSYVRHQWAINIIKSLGFSLTELETRLSTKIMEDLFNEDWVKDIESKLEYLVIKFGVSFPKKNFKEMELKDKIKFLSKIIEAQYGLIISKDNGKNYYLTDNNKWDDLYEFRNKKSGVGLKLNEKIVKKEKSNISMDSSWFEE